LIVKTILNPAVAYVKCNLHFAYCFFAPPEKAFSGFQFLFKCLFEKRKVKTYLRKISLPHSSGEYRVSAYSKGNKNGIQGHSGLADAWSN
jgi:hypothetical protein